MPLVQPLPADHDPEVEALACFFNTRLGFPPNSVPTLMRRPALARAFTELERAVPATADGRRWLAAQGWSAGKPGAQDTAPGGDR